MPKHCNHPHDRLDVYVKKPPVFTWRPNHLMTTICGYDNKLITIPADLDMWLPMFVTTPSEFCTTRNIAQLGNTCHDHNKNNCELRTGINFEMVEADLAERGYTDASILCLAMVMQQLGHWRHGKNEQSGVWPTWCGIQNAFADCELQGAIAAAKKKEFKDHPGMYREPHVANSPGVATYLDYCAKYFFVGNHHAYLLYELERLGKTNEVFSQYGLLNWLEPKTEAYLTRLMEGKRVVDGEGDLVISDDPSFTTQPEYADREHALDIIKRLRDNARILTTGEWNILAERVLIRAGWDKEYHGREKPGMCVGFGEITVLNLPHCKTERVTVKLEEIVDEDGKILDRETAIAKLDATYGDVRPAVAVEGAPDLKISVVLADWLKDTAPSMDNGSIEVDGPWRYLPDFLEEISFDADGVTEIEEGRAYEVDGKTYPAVDFKIGADSWTLVLLHGQRAPIGHAKQDQAKRKADRLADEAMVRIATEQACDSFDDVWGQAWLKHEFGIEAERVNTRWTALPERQKKAFKEWAKGVMESPADGWQQNVCSYDGRAFTSGVVTRTVTKKPMIFGFAYWRT